MKAPNFLTVKRKAKDFAFSVYTVMTAALASLAFLLLHTILFWPSAFVFSAAIVSVPLLDSDIPVLLSSLSQKLPTIMDASFGLAFLMAVCKAILDFCMPSLPENDQ